MGHPKIHCVDYTRNDNPITSWDNFEFSLMDFYAFAEANNQTHLLGGIPENEGKVRKKGDKIRIEQKSNP